MFHINPGGVRTLGAGESFLNPINCGVEEFLFFSERKKAETTIVVTVSQAGNWCVFCFTNIKVKLELLLRLKLQRK